MLLCIGNINAIISIGSSNMLIAPCSTADSGIAGAVLIQNKPITKIERLTILEKSCPTYKMVSQTLI